MLFDISSKFVLPRGYHKLRVVKITHHLTLFDWYLKISPASQILGWFKSFWKDIFHTFDPRLTLKRRPWSDKFLQSLGANPITLPSRLLAALNREHYSPHLRMHVCVYLWRWCTSLTVFLSKVPQILKNCDAYLWCLQNVHIAKSCNLYTIQWIAYYTWCGVYERYMFPVS